MVDQDEFKPTPPPTSVTSNGVGTPAEERGLATYTRDITPDPSLLPKSGQVNYSIPDAIGELVDNEVDARIAGELLTVEIYIGLRDGGTIQVRGDGRGMNGEELAAALRMGYSGKEVGAIGQFGLGLKTACTNLGRTFDVVTVPLSGDRGFRTVYDEATFLSNGRWEIDIEEIEKPFARGTAITVMQPKVSIYGGVKDTVALAMGRIFRHFMKAEQLEVYVNGDIVLPFEWDLFDEYTEEFSCEVNGKTAHGWIGLQQKPSAKTGYGFELIRHSRVVKRHEKVGFSPHPKLTGIVGEVHLDDFAVVNNKTDFVRDTDDWRRFEDEMRKIVRPLVELANKKYQTTLGSREKVMVADATEKVEAAIRSEEFARSLDRRLLADALTDQLAPKSVERRQRKPDTDKGAGSAEDDETLEEVQAKRARTPRELHEVLRRTRTQLLDLQIEHTPVRYGAEAAYKWWEVDGMGTNRKLLVSSNLDHPMFGALDDTITWVKHNIAEAAAEYLSRETGLSADMIKIKSDILRFVGELQMADEREDQGLIRAPSAPTLPLG